MFCLCASGGQRTGLTLGGDAVLVRAAGEAPVVGVQPCNMAGPVAPWGGALHLLLVWVVRREHRGGRREEREYSCQVLEECSRATVHGHYIYGLAL